MKGQPLANALIIEVFAGTSRVTASLRHFGMFSCFGVDHMRSANVAAPISIADLTTAEGVKLLYSWLANPAVVGLFLAPPCGTASRARTIPLRGKRKAPEPLRDDLNPNGLKHLRWIDKVKISKSNKLYDLTADLVNYAHKHGLLICVENPQFSLFWATSFWLRVSHKVMYIVFHSCQYGSRRQKKTMLAHNHHTFSELNLRCPGESKTHSHAKWGRVGNRFATAEETAYPFPLARCIAHAFIKALLQCGLVAPPDTIHDLQSSSSQILQAIRAQVNTQPKATRLPPLVPEFKQVIQVSGAPNMLPSNDTIRLEQDFRLSSSVVSPIRVIPQQSKLFKTGSILAGSVKGGVPVETSQKLLFDKSAGEPAIEQTWGVPWSPEEFVSQAILAGHPCSLKSFVPKVLQQAVSSYDSVSTEARCKMRISKLKYWVDVLAKLQPQEKEFKSRLAPHIQKVLQRKNLLLYKHMLEQCNYPDMGVFDEFVNGTSLIGDSEVTGLWPRRHTPNTCTESDLQSMSSRDRATSLKSVVDRFDPSVGTQVWEQTMAETEKGFLEGPLNLESIPGHCPLSPRFGIRQGQKVRCIDDFSRSGVNSAVQTHESPRPHTIDVVSGLALMIMNTTRSESPWLVRGFDLKEAYRQCAVHCDSLKYSHIIVVDPSTMRPCAFRMIALPFGSVKSVHGFLRVAHSIWFIAVHQLRVLWTNYFDDYVTFCPEVEASHMTQVIHTFLDLLGWTFAREGSKAPPFDKTCSALGVVINVSALHRGSLSVDNSEGRKSEMSSFISRILSSGHLSTCDALRLRGRMQFASGQLYGRAVRVCMGHVTNHAYTPGSTKLSRELEDSLKRYLAALKMDKPRSVHKSSDTTWYIFTDASYEPDGSSHKAGFGGVLVSPDGQYREFFTFELRDSLLDRLNIGKRKTIIFECEFLALLVALQLWACKLKSSQLVCYIDNNSVRDATIACYTSNKVGETIMSKCLELEDEFQLQSWFARAPSPSNPSDWPSRGSSSELLKLGCVEVTVDPIEVLERINLK